MDIVKAMQVFATVVEEGGFSRAADKLATSGAAVSRQIAALENHLGALLLQRTTRRLSLTEPGEALYERAQQLLASIAETEAVVGQYALRLSGSFRISAPLSFGIHQLAPVLPEFHRRHPDLQFDIDLSDRVVDLVHEGFDLAIRITRAPSPNLIARKIARINMIVCAAPGYLAERGVPMTPADLAGHDTLGYSYLSSSDNWEFYDAAGTAIQVRIQPTVHATNGDLLRHLALADGGIMAQPDFIVSEDIASGKLQRILTEWSFGEFNLYVVYVSRRFLPAKMRVFIDYLVEVWGEFPHR
ncbi:LysR family transcriptional regulator [Sodalis sp. C49]|uniref:LysR family transcriptional regulator n=1 Tax=Sodalis sp. C49 TaxID=3228929 RepID=UPI0039659BCF